MKLKPAVIAIKFILYKRDSTYIVLNDISHYFTTTIYLSKFSRFDLNNLQNSSGNISNSSNENQVDKCQKSFNSIRLIRSHMKDKLYLIETLFKEPNKMIELTSDVFVDCMPLLLRNFISLLILSDYEFKQLENNYVYYDLFSKDLLQKSCKSLKIRP